MIRRLGGSEMEDTDRKWLRTIVYNALIGHVDVVRILHSTSTWPSSTPDWWKYILTMAFRLVMAGNEWDLEGDTNEDLRRKSQYRKLTQAFCGTWLYNSCGME
jgi:hypothetical protein